MKVGKFCEGVIAICHKKYIIDLFDAQKYCIQNIYMCNFFYSECCPWPLNGILGSDSKKSINPRQKLGSI